MSLFGYVPHFFKKTKLANPNPNKPFRKSLLGPYGGITNVVVWACSMFRFFKEN